MIKLQGPIKCEVKESPGKGLGVFATEFIAEGEIIEECHLITLPIPYCHTNILEDYRFNYPQGTAPTEQVLPLGYGCIYNHSNENNATWRDHPEYKVFQYIAKRDIQPGEEICTYYGNVFFH